MMAKREKVIRLWLDTSRSGDEPDWVVSDDVLDTRGRCVATSTAVVYPADDYDGAYDKAIARGRARGQRVVETAEDGSQEVLWAPNACDNCGEVTSRLYSLDVHEDGKYFELPGSPLGQAGIQVCGDCRGELLGD